MFRNMRRKGQQLTQEECEDILTSQPREVLALLGDYDYPYAKRDTKMMQFRIIPNAPIVLWMMALKLQTAGGILLKVS